MPSAADVILEVGDVSGYGAAHGVLLAGREKFSGPSNRIAKFS